MDTFEVISKVQPHVVARSKTIKDAIPYVSQLTKRPTYEQQPNFKISNNDMTVIGTKFSKVNNTDDVDLVINDIANELGISRQKAYLIVRYILTGSDKGIPISVIIDALGMEETAVRINNYKSVVGGE